MQQMMSRYGGHNYLLCKCKASYQDPPEDQSLDNLLDSYAPEIIPNHYYVSAYDAQFDWMGQPTLRHQMYRGRRVRSKSARSIVAPLINSPKINS